MMPLLNRKERAFLWQVNEWARYENLWKNWHRIGAPNEPSETPKQAEAAQRAAKSAERREKKKEERRMIRPINHCRRWRALRGAIGNNI